MRLGNHLGSSPRVDERVEPAAGRIRHGVESPPVGRGIGDVADAWLACERRAARLRHTWERRRPIQACHAFLPGHRVAVRTPV
jgi:hypothetical protein